MVSPELKLKTQVNEGNPHYKKGAESKVAVVLTCPGRAEKDAGKPAAGHTGTNLNELLDILNKKVPKFVRDNITITNSWNRVEFEECTGRTHPSMKEVRKESNLQRLAAEVQDISDYILCFGPYATDAVKKLSSTNRLRKSCRVLYARCHIGNQGLNTSIKCRLDGSPIRCYSCASDKPEGVTDSLEKIKHDNRIVRLQVVASDLVNKIRAQ